MLFPSVLETGIRKEIEKNQTKGAQNDSIV